MSDIDEYNELINEWNNRFGGTCELRSVSDSDFSSSFICRLKMIFSSDMSGRRKVKMNNKVLSEFSSVYPEKVDGELSRGELARIIIQKSSDLQTFQGE